MGAGSSNPPAPGWPSCEGVNAFLPRGSLGFLTWLLLWLNSKDVGKHSCHGWERWERLRINLASKGGKSRLATLARKKKEKPHGCDWNQPFLAGTQAASPSARAQRLRLAAHWADPNYSRLVLLSWPGQGRQKLTPGRAALKAWHCNARQGNCSKEGHTTDASLQYFLRRPENCQLRTSSLLVSDPWVWR